MSLHDPFAARDLINHTGLLNQAHEAVTMTLILRLAEADYGTSLRLLSSESTELNLSGRQVDLFDRFAQESQLQDAQRALAGDLAAKVANRTGLVIARPAVQDPGRASLDLAFSTRSA